MKNLKLNNQYDTKNIRNHPTIRQVQIIENKPNFPISWLNIQGYCEYCLYLEKFQGITRSATKQMIAGTKQHNKLEAEFKEDAEVKTLDEIITQSQSESVLSREFFVISPKYGIRGFIDEIWLEPDRIVIIDDKPSDKAYMSMKNQVYAYALAYEDMMDVDDRDITVALRRSTTGEIFWSDKFSSENREHIKGVVEHVQNLISMKDEFISTENPNKCNACRFNDVCNQMQN